MIAQDYKSILNSEIETKKKENTLISMVLCASSEMKQFVQKLHHRLADLRPIGKLSSHNLHIFTIIAKPGFS